MRICVDRCAIEAVGKIKESKKPLKELADFVLAALPDDFRVFHMGTGKGDKLDLVSKIRLILEVCKKILEVENE